MDYNNTVVLYGRGAKHLDPSVGGDQSLTLEEFANAETRVVINRSVRDQDILFVQSFGRINGSNLSPNDLFMEALFTCDAINRAGCRSLTVLFPLMPYTRQDRKHKPGVPLSAKVVCDCLLSMNIDRFITFDLHADQIQGFMPNSTVFDHLSLLPYMSMNILSFLKEYLVKNGNTVEDAIMCATDAGAVYRTRRMGDLLFVYQLALISKLRDKHNSVQSGQLVGDVNGKTCILVDDMIDTGGSLVNAYDLLKENGAEKIIVIATHGVLSNNALSKLSVFDKVILSDTIPHCTKDLLAEYNNIEVISIMPFLTEGLFPRINHKLLIGDLMDPHNWHH